MTIKNAYQLFCESIESHYGFRETQNMAKIVFEDEFRITNFDREDLFPDNQKQRLQEIQDRLVQQEPLQYILGQADFYGLKCKVNPNVLIPRPETEELVYLVLNSVKSDRTLKVLDIGTGSGCIAITLAKKNSFFEMYASDIHPGTIDTAKENAITNNVSVQFYKNDILDRGGWSELGNFDVIISNPPYIPASESHLMPDHVKSFEPERALFVGDHDPLIFYRTIAEFAALHLNKAGYLFFETNEYNAKEVLIQLRDLGFQQIELLQDLSGKDRMIKAIKGVN